MSTRNDGTTAASKRPPQKRTRAAILRPKELMVACGSESGRWEPESPDQWIWTLANGEGRERALAWVKLHSIARGHAWCVDLAGKHLRIESMASDLGWELQTARNACAQLVHEGRIKTQAGKIFYRANVPEELPADESPDLDENILCTKYFPAYLHDFIRSLPEPRKAVLKQYATWRPKLYAEGLRALRLIDDQMQDNILSALGCKEKLHLKKDASPNLEWVGLTLTKPPDFVQSIAAPAAEVCTEAAATLNKVSPADVQSSEQTGPTLLVLASTRASAKKERAPSSWQYAMIAERLTIDDDAARKLLSAVRRENPTVTPREVAILGLKKLHQIGDRAKNRVGLLLSAVPKMAHGVVLNATREDAAREIEVERREAEAWMAADPRDYDTLELSGYLLAEQDKAQLKLQQLDQETHA